jgi:hypothetical protein
MLLRKKSLSLNGIPKDEGLFMKLSLYSLELIQISDSLLVAIKNFYYCKNKLFQS